MRPDGPTAGRQSVASSTEHLGITHLKTLDANGRHHLVAIDLAGAVSGRTFAPGAWSEMEGWIAAHAHANQYFSVNEPRAGLAQTAKLKKADIGAIRAVYADLDPRKGADVAAERERLYRLAETNQRGLMPASWATDSGNGVQFFWLLGEKLDADAHGTWAEAQCRGLASQLHGDAVHNIDRIMRLPGTTNHPTPKKLARGLTGGPVSVVHKRNVAWTPEDLARQCAPIHEADAPSASAPEIAAVEAEIDLDTALARGDLNELPPALRTRLSEVGRNDRHFRALVSGLEEAAPADTSSSGWRAALAAAMGRHGFDAQDYADVVVLWLPGQPSSGRDLSLRDVAREWARIGLPAAASSDPMTWFEIDPVVDVSHFPSMTERSEKSGSSAWLDPVDLFDSTADGALPNLKKGILPDLIDAFVFDEADRKGVAPIFCAAAALATVSGAIGSRFRIQPKALDNTWTEPAFLWFALVENPGGKKSPVISGAVKPLSKLDQMHGSEDARRRHEWENARKKKAKDDTAVGPSPQIRRYVVDNFTREALAGVLSENPYGVLVSADELTGLIGGLDAYKSSKGSDRPIMLRLFDGRDLRVDRAGSGPTFVPCWGASIIGGIQPKKIQEAASNWEADGMLQRFLPIMGDDKRRTVADRIPDRAALAAYDETVVGLTQKASFFDEPVTLTPEAQAVRRRFEIRINALRDLPDIAEGWQAHLGKWPGIFARLLLIFQLVELWPDQRRIDILSPVSRETAERTAQFADLLLAHALRFYEGCIGTGQTGDDARWIAGHLLTKGPMDRVTRRSITEAKTQWRSEPGRVASAMRFLEAVGWVQGDLSERADRWGASRWAVNPLIYELFADQASVEAQRRSEMQARIIEARTARRRLTDGQ